MSPDRRLQEAFRGLAVALYPDDVLLTERAVRGAISEDGTVRSEALTTALPWQRIDFRLPGVVAVGPSQGGIYELPQGGVIRRIRASARVAPSATALTMHIAVNGATIDTGSIQPGQTTVASGAAIDVPAGGVVTLNIASAGAAEDVTVNCFYSSGSAP